MQLYEKKPFIKFKVKVVLAVPLYALINHQISLYLGRQVVMHQTEIISLSHGRGKFIILCKKWTMSPDNNFECKKIK